MRNWALIAILSGAAVPCAAQDHYETSEADPAQAAQEDTTAEVISAPPPAPPSGPGVSGISRRLSVPRPPARAPSRASGSGSAAPAKGPTRATGEPKAVVRPFLTGYVGVPYLANPYAKAPHFKAPQGDDSFGYDMGGTPTSKEVPHITASHLPGGLAMIDDLPGAGGTVKGVLLGAPQKAGVYSPLVDFRVGTAPGVERPVFKGRAGLRILPAPRRTVLNPVERAPGMIPSFENDGPALLKVRFGAAGETASGQLRSVDGAVDKRVYFEAYIQKVGYAHAARVGVEAGRYSHPRGYIGDLDGWGYGFSGSVFVPSGGFAGRHVDNGRVNDSSRKLPFDQYQRLAHPSKVVPGDVIMVALDPVAGNIWFGKNGRWFEGGDPAAGETPTVYGITLPSTAYHGDFRAAVGGAAGTTVVMNFGDQPWRYAPPRGFAGIPRRAPARR